MPEEPLHETIPAVSRGEESVRGSASSETAGGRAREDEVRFRDMAESLPQLVWTCDLQGICDYLSPRWAEFTGVPVEKHIGSIMVKLVLEEADDDHRRVLAVITYLKAR